MNSVDIESQATARYEAIRTLVPSSTPIATLIVGEDTMAIAQGHALTPEEVIVMDIGTVSIMENCFKSNPPGPLDLERAIHWIEEAISQPRMLKLSNAILYLSDQILQEIRRPLRSHKPAPTLLTADGIEIAFTHLVSASQGGAAISQKDGHAAHNAACLLIVRELVHHWAFYTLATF
jgi:hypothetical protein